MLQNNYISRIVNLLAPEKDEGRSHLSGEKTTFILEGLTKPLLGERRNLLGSPTILLPHPEHFQRFGKQVNVKDVFIGL